MVITAGWSYGRTSLQLESPQATGIIICVAHFKLPELYSIHYITNLFDKHEIQSSIFGCCDRLGFGLWSCSCKSRRVVARSKSKHGFVVKFSLILTTITHFLFRTPFTEIIPEIGLFFCFADGMGR